MGSVAVGYSSRTGQPTVEVLCAVRGMVDSWLGVGSRMIEETSA